MYRIDNIVDIIKSHEQGKIPEVFYTDTLQIPELTNLAAELVETNRPESLLILNPSYKGMSPRVCLDIFLLQKYIKCDFTLAYQFAILAEYLGLKSALVDRADMDSGEISVAIHPELLKEQNLFLATKFKGLNSILPDFQQPELSRSDLHRLIKTRRGIPNITNEDGGNSQVNFIDHIEKEVREAVPDWEGKFYMAPFSVNDESKRIGELLNPQWKKIRRLINRRNINELLPLIKLELSNMISNYVTTINWSRKSLLEFLHQSNADMILINPNYMLLSDRLWFPDTSYEDDILESDIVETLLRSIVSPYFSWKILPEQQILDDFNNIDDIDLLTFTVNTFLISFISQLVNKKVSIYSKFNEVDVLNKAYHITRNIMEQINIEEVREKSIEEAIGSLADRYLEIEN